MVEVKQGQNFVYLFLILLAVYFLFFFNSCARENFGIDTIKNAITDILPKRPISEGFSVNYIADTLSDMLPRRQTERFSLNDMKNQFRDNINYMLG